MTGSLVSRESVATSIASFSLVNLTTAPHQPSKDLALQTLRQERHKDHRPEISSFLTLMSSADWNPTNSARRESKPISLASITSTPTPTPYTLLPQHGHLINQYPYEKLVFVTPLPNPRPFQHPLLSVLLLPKLNSNTNESNEKQWMPSKVYSFQAEIENLNREKAARLHHIDTID